MQFHTELNPVLWDKENDNQMRPEVITKLQEIAEAFIEYLEIPQDAVLDKVVTGSSASYNYNKFSDLDLHIIVDYDKVHEDCPLVNGYLNSLKKQFNDNHDITIHGVPVELYAEQKDQGTVHNGLYSLQTGWIDKPQKIAPTDNDAAVEAKFNEIKELVDKCDDSEEATELLDKIYTMRKAGLATAGEFCTENLAFKKLRNEGCMDKLRQIKKEQIDKQLSLESYNEEQNMDKLNRIDSVEDIYNGMDKILFEDSFKLDTESTNPGRNYIKRDEIGIIHKVFINPKADVGEYLQRYTIIFPKTNRDWDVGTKRSNPEALHNLDSFEVAYRFDKKLIQEEIDDYGKKITYKYVLYDKETGEYLDGGELSYSTKAKAIQARQKRAELVGCKPSSIGISKEKGKAFIENKNESIKELSLESYNEEEIRTTQEQLFYMFQNWAVEAFQELGYITEKPVYNVKQKYPNIAIAHAKGDFLVMYINKEDLDKCSSIYDFNGYATLITDGYGFEDSWISLDVENEKSSIEEIKAAIDNMVDNADVNLRPKKTKRKEFRQEFLLNESKKQLSLESYNEDSGLPTWPEQFQTENSLTSDKCNSILNDIFKDNGIDVYVKKSGHLVEFGEHFYVANIYSKRYDKRVAFIKFDYLDNMFIFEEYPLHEYEIITHKQPGTCGSFKEFCQKVVELWKKYKKRDLDTLQKNESIKESEDELTLEDKLINILTKDGWNHLNGRGGESLEKDNITIDLYVDSVIFNEFEDDEEELPLETEEDLQNIIQTANELSNKNESIKEINVDEDVNTLEQKIDAADTTLKDLMDKLNSVTEEIEDTEFVLEKANKLIDEALRED